MAKFNANPAAEASAGFEAVRPGEYIMRFKTVEDRASIGKTDYKCTLEHTTPKEELVNDKGEALKGNPGGVFVYLAYDSERQGMLKAACLAMGLPWQDYDITLPEAEGGWIGREIKVALKLDTYEGTVSNKVARFVVPK